VQAYWTLARWKEGNTKSNSNIICTALHKGIPNPQKKSLSSMNEAINFASAEKRLLRGNAPEFRKEHLHECLLKTKTAKDKERAKGSNQRWKERAKRKYGALSIGHRKI